MKLHHLKYTACPTCGARVVFESQRAQHTNGQWFEAQRFECQYEIEWVPNYSRQLITKKCPTSPEMVERTKELASADKALQRFIMVTVRAPLPWRVRSLRSLGFYDAAKGLEIDTTHVSRQDLGC